MANNTNKKTIVARINAAAMKYKSNLVGNTFLIIFEGNCIELSFRAKNFYIYVASTRRYRELFRFIERHAVSMG